LNEKIITLIESKFIENHRLVNVMRYYAFLQALEWLSICSASSLPSSSKRMLKKFSSLVVFGDSYTDQGLHQYRPLSDGTIGKPVCEDKNIWNFLLLHTMFPLFKLILTPICRKM
jgi:hypothetical protein